MQRAVDYAFRDDQNKRAREKTDYVAGALWPAGFADDPREFARRIDATAALNL